MRLDPGFSVSGFEPFGRPADLEERLRSMLGCEVDVVEEPVTQERIQREIDKDRAVVF